MSKIDITEYIDPVTEDDMAIIDHIFKTERGRRESTRGGDRDIVIHSYQLPIYEDSMTLGLKPSEKFDDPDAYRFLLYHYLLRMNHGLLDGSRISILPNHGMGCLRSLMHIENDNYAWKVLSRQAGKNVPGFPMRIIYADLVRASLENHPFCLDTHRFIEETLQQKGLNYAYLRPETRKLLSSVDPDRRFYWRIDSVPLAELFLTANEFPSEGVYGRVMNVMLADRISMFGKINNIDDMETIHEYRIGMELNKLYDRCPFIMYTYGITNVYLGGNQLGNYIAVLDNHSSSEITPGPSIRAVMFAQWLPNSVNLERFIKNITPCQEIGPEGEPRDVPHDVAVGRVISAIIATLRFLWDEIEFTHNDLHLENIHVMFLDKPMLIRLPNTDHIFNLNAIPVLIDYGFSMVTKPTLYEYPLISSIPNSVPNPLDRRIRTDRRYIFDMDKLLNNLYQYDNILGEDLMYDITAMHFRLYTGKSLDQTDGFVGDLVTSSMARFLGSASTNPRDFVNRIPPLGLTSYDPDGAVDEFLSWMIDEDTREESPRCAPTKITDQIYSEISDGNIDITTASGVVAHHLYPRLFEGQDWTVRQLPSAQSSLDNLRRILEEAYDGKMKMLEDLYEKEPDRREITKMSMNIMKLVRQYRAQINDMIQELI